MINNYMSIKDDIINGLDRSTEFTDKVSKLVHMPTSVVKSLTEPLGLKDYMNLAKAVDEEDPESAKKILLDIGFPQLDDVAKKVLGEYTSKGTVKPSGTSSAGSRTGDTDTSPEDKPEPEIDDKTKDAIDKIADKSAEIVQFADIVAKNKKM
jgi:hypothetical protein|tara:strand:- start:669 stop:1124 length:456 start_codon:yes stop_codon:yes gene_type:complete